MVVLSRPQVRNAASAAMLRELASALGRLAEEPSVRAVVLAGDGPDFCAGADLDELEAGLLAAAPGDSTEPLDAVLRAVADHPVPVIAQVQGAALGAGCQLVVACDLAVAAEDARLGIPSGRLGALIGFHSLERLVLSLGPKRAGEMLLSGRTLSGQDAAAWGIVNRAVPGAALGGETLALGRSVAEAAPISIRGSKRGIAAVVESASVHGEGTSVPAEYERMRAAALASEDLREGVRAFRERRKPAFRGR